MPAESNSQEVPKKGAFPHFMLKEIYEQPQAIEHTIRRHVDGNNAIFPSELDAIERALQACGRIIIAASGSSRHAGLAGELMIEDMSGVPVDVEYASEYCYRTGNTTGDAVVAVISQSGETADTLAAERAARARGARTVAITNVAGSTLAREANANLLTCAAPEVAVPATKSFTTQLTVLYLLALFMAVKRGRMGSEAVRMHLRWLREIPEGIERSLADWNSRALECARRYQEVRSVLYLGRGVHYAIAREGALKLKEVSYAHAEGYPTGELRHGPNALVDEQGLVVMLATSDPADPDSTLRYQKNRGVLENVKQHGGNLIVVATEGDRELDSLTGDVLFVPPAPELLLPLLEVVPLQLLAYHMAILNGCDVDHPRNLEKAVTTE
jgi:glucosamine--fructose-6-phosphate aminotransferase (isomerizing)